MCLWATIALTNLLQLWWQHVYALTLAWQLMCCGSMQFAAKNKRALTSKDFYLFVLEKYFKFNGTFLNSFPHHNLRKNNCFCLRSSSMEVCTGTQYCGMRGTIKNNIGFLIYIYCIKNYHTTICRAFCLLLMCVSFCHILIILLFPNV